MNQRRNILLAAALVAAGLAFPAAAQVKAGAPPAEVAAYAGADREQKLAEGAKKEGELNIYTSAQTDDMGALEMAAGDRTICLILSSTTRLTVNRAKTSRSPMNAYSA